MSNLELKGDILELIAKVNNKQSLKELATIIREFVGNHAQDTDFAEELSAAQLDQLNSAIEESKKEESLLDHKSVMKRFTK